MTDQPQYDPEVVDAPRQQVDRRRRFRFVAMVVGFCLIASVALAALSLPSPAIPTLIDGLISLATVLSLWYVSGSVVDYNGGFGGMVRGGGRGTRSLNTAPPQGTGLPPRR